MPLSATYRPYRLAAFATAFACGSQLSGTTKSARRRKREPNGIAPGLAPPAPKRPGHVCAVSIALSRKVTRSAWRISPVDASAALASNGVIGSPAASEEPHWSGRNALDFRSHSAVDTAYHLPPRLCAKYDSHRRHAPFSTTRTWWSPQVPGPPQLPPSAKVTPLGNGKRRALAGTVVQSRVTA